MKDRFSLFLMTYKGYCVLEEVVGRYAGLIERVITASDEHIEKDYCKEIRDLCTAHSIPCCDRTDQYSITSTYAMSVSWRWLLRLQPSKLIILHDSLLPKYRGFNPLVSYLINGERCIGVTSLWASESFDRGDIIAQESIDIEYPITIKVAIDISTSLYVKLAISIFDAVAHGRSLQSRQQNEQEVTYSLWRDEDDYRIDWKRDATDIRRFIDAVGPPYKGASSIMEGRLVRILAAEAISDVTIENRTCGKILFTEGIHPIVVCETGLLRLNSMVDDETSKELLPLKKFRIRFS